MEPERETHRQTYRLCRLGFAILSLSLALASFTSILMLAALFGARGLVAGIVNLWWWRWVDTPIIWGCLLGTYFLWGRWNDAGWQRRVGLLVVMNLVDVFLWALDHGDDLALRLGEAGPFGNEWLRSHLGQALGWAELALLASLAGDLLSHLGLAQAREASKSTRSLAATGAVVWMLLFCQSTAWNHWPLERRPNFSIETLLLHLGTTMILTITLIQVTALSIAATRETSRILREMDHEDRNDDLFRSPSESVEGLLHNSPDPLA